MFCCDRAIDDKGADDDGTVGGGDVKNLREASLREQAYSMFYNTPKIKFPIF